MPWSLNSVCNWSSWPHFEIHISFADRALPINHSCNLTFGFCLFGLGCFACESFSTWYMLSSHTYASRQSESSGCCEEIQYKIHCWSVSSTTKSCTSLRCSMLVQGWWIHGLHIWAKLSMIGCTTGVYRASCLKTSPRLLGLTDRLLCSLTCLHQATSASYLGRL